MDAECLKTLEHGLNTETARHDRVVPVVAGEEPILLDDSLLSMGVTLAVFAAIGNDVDRVQEFALSRATAQ